MTTMKQMPAWLRISDNLRDAIISHDLKPGTRLAEDELCAIYGHGRSVVRTALRTLAQEGLLTHVPNRGVHVSHPSPEAAGDVFEARLLVEPHIASIAADKATTGHIAMLERNLHGEEVALASRSGEAIRSSANFHITLATIAGNSFLTETVTELVSRSSLIIALYWRKTSIICDHSAHQELLSSIAEKDGERAARLMRLHIDDIRDGLDLSDGPDRPARDLSDILNKGAPA